MPLTLCSFKLGPRTASHPRQLRLEGQRKLRSCDLDHGRAAIRVACSVELRPIRIFMPLRAEPGETIDEFRGAFFTMNDATVRIACGITNLALIQLAASRKSTRSNLAAVFYGYRDVIEGIAAR